jgi:signal peptidase I
MGVPPAWEQSDGPGENRLSARQGRGWFRRTFYAPRPPQGEHAGMSLCLELQLERQGQVWLAARGTSMLPWRLPGWELRFERGLQPAIGAILVFRHGAKLYYHRAVERIGPDHWRTKGDTLLEADEPVSENDIVGQVTGVRREGRVCRVRADASAAWLSRQLGLYFGRPGRPSGRAGRLGRRAAYLIVLLSAWPFRRLLARGRLDARNPTPAPAMRKD